MSRPGWLLRGLVLAATVPALFNAPVLAQPYTTLVPRGPSDWREAEKSPHATWSVEVTRPAKAGADPLWDFHADAPADRAGEQVILGASLESLGVAPPLPADAEYWTWHWYVANTKTADRIVLSLIDEHGTRVALATSHAIHDYLGDLFALPGKYQEAHTTLTEAARTWEETRGRPFPELGRIVAIEIDMDGPVDQELWLGSVAFSRARETPVPPSPRAHPDLRLEGRSLFVDLDGDGRVEVVTPWVEGPKVWRYRDGRFRLDARHDALAECGALSVLAAADLDGDGDLDLVGVGSDQRRFHAFLNREGGFTATEWTSPLPSRRAITTSIALADDDGDGRVDLFVGYHLVAEYLTDVGRIFRFPGLGGGRFGARQTIPSTWNRSHWGTYFVAVLDLDGDAVPDLVSAAGGIGVHVFRGLGGGRYGEGRHVLHPVQAGYFRDIAFGDIDGNGLPDLYVAMLRAPGDDVESGQNYLLLNDGGFRFDEVSLSTGTNGTPATEDACFAELNGRPGPELVVLEQDHIGVYDVAAWRDAGARRDGVVPMVAMLAGPDPVAGARMLDCVDLDGDGAVEAILSRETGPEVVAIPGSGPVRTVRVGGFGPGGDGIGGRLAGDGWSLPALSNSRIVPGPWLVAATEAVRFERGGAVAIGETTPRAGMRESLVAGSAGAFAWLRWRAPTLWEGPWSLVRRRDAQVVGGLVAIGGLGLLLVRTRRSAARQLTEANWLRLLGAIGVTSHAKWREAFTNFGRILRHVSASGAVTDPATLKQLRELLPPEVLATVREGATAAADLELDGGRAAVRSVRTLESLHGDADPDPEALRAAVGTLDDALGLIQRALALRFSADAGAVVRSVLAFHEKRGATLPPVDFRPDDDALARAFPVRADHLFTCLDELLTNAAKKEPAPTRIEIVTGRDGQHRAFLDVIDDGRPVAAEGERDARPGSRSGLRRLEAVLSAYAGSVQLDDRDEGGVRARIRVPRFDLDA